jgi:hypothetical protein
MALVSKDLRYGGYTAILKHIRKPFERYCGEESQAIGFSFLILASAALSILPKLE